MSQSISSTTQTESQLPAERQWSELPVEVYCKIAIVGILFYAFFHMEITRIVSAWVSNPSWSHGFLIPVFSIYFLNQRKQQLLNQKQNPSLFLGSIGILFFLAVYVLNLTQFKIAYGRPLIMIAALGSIVYLFGGFSLIKYTWLPIGFLFFAVPLPGRLYSQITIPMRQLASQVASLILDIVPNLEATARGVVIDVMYKGQPLEPSLDVAEACSGMRLLMAFVALGVAMAYLQERPIWQRLILLSSTIPIAIFCNIVRVTITGFIYILGDPQYAQGIYHDLLGMLMLPLAFFLYGGLAWLMNNLFVEEETATEPNIIQRKRPSSTEAE